MPIRHTNQGRLLGGGHLVAAAFVGSPRYTVSLAKERGDARSPIIAMWRGGDADTSPDDCDAIRAAGAEQE